MMESGQQDSEIAGTVEQQAPANQRFQFRLVHVLLFTAVCAVALAAAAQLGVFWGAWWFCLLGSLLAGTIVRRTWLWAGIPLLLLVVACLFPAIPNAREARNRHECGTRMHRIAAALHEYHQDYGCFPPACVTDGDGQPMHSWRVLILPYLGEQALYDAYDFGQPWDGPRNRRLHSRILSVYCCPAQGRWPSQQTNYVAVVGPETIWPPRKSTSFADCSDGLNATILVAEVADTGIHWMEPRDLDFATISFGVNPKKKNGVSSHHMAGAMVVFGDKSVSFLSDNTPPEAVRAMLTRKGAEKVETDW